MRYYLLCRHEDTKVGLRLSGIEGEIVRDKKTLEERIRVLCAKEDIAVLLVSEGCASMSRSLINSLRISSQRPLVVVIPEPDKTGTSTEISDLIRDTIGVKI